MNVMVIGSGGREHALVWKLARSPEVDRVFAAPGNGGTAREEKTENVPVDDPAGEAGQEALAAFARERAVGLTVVGPEAPLAAGIVDRFRGAGLAIVGPGARAARLEASKVYSKGFMEKYGVRTARARSFGPGEADQARAWLEERGAPAVIKADGLAAGKGVVVAGSLDEARSCVAAFMEEGVLGEPGRRLVIEDFLEGEEVSIMAAVGGGGAAPFIAARDHKRRFAGNRGPNTGGMGAIAPAPGFGPEAAADFTRAILNPTLRGLEAEGLDYRGFLFFGLMVKDNRCSLLEYNVRLGDPETQALLPLLDTDLYGLCRAMLEGGLERCPLTWKSGFCCAPVAVAGGYPGSYRSGEPIALDEAALAASGAKLFFAGARGGPGELRTAGGRVLAAAGVAASSREARERAYAALGAVSFAGMDFRRDIGGEG